MLFFIRNFKLFLFQNSDCNNAEQYGIISPYNNQVEEIKKKLSSYKSLQDFDVKIVNQFQCNSIDLIHENMFTNVFLVLHKQR